MRQRAIAWMRLFILCVVLKRYLVCQMCLGTYSFLPDEYTNLFNLKNEGIQLRRNEKKTLNDVNADKEGRLRFHINDNKGKRKKRIQTREEKLFVLANDWLTGDPSVHDLSMTQVHQSYIPDSFYLLITVTF